MVVLGLWTAMVAKAPVDSGPASPQFLSVNFGSLIAFVFFVSWGVALRGNPAAHKRIMILSTVAILDPGYGRLSSWLWPEPQSMLLGISSTSGVTCWSSPRWLLGMHGAAV